MVGYQLDDSQSLHRKWLEITKHLFINGCLGFQVILEELILSSLIMGNFGDRRILKVTGIFVHAEKIKTYAAQGSCFVEKNQGWMGC